MIFIGFLLIYGIFLIFAFFSGNVFHFINPDSLLISPVTVFIFSICTFKWNEFRAGIKTMFSFAKPREPSQRVAGHYKSLMLISFAAGIVSTIQGLISYSLSKRDMVDVALNMPFTEAFSYSIFSTAYGIMYSVFLFYPVYLLHSNDK